jgi:hypothetical protein
MQHRRKQPNGKDRIKGFISSGTPWESSIDATAVPTQCRWLWFSSTPLIPGYLSSNFKKNRHTYLRVDIVTIGLSVRGELGNINSKVGAGLIFGGLAFVLLDVCSSK